MKKKISKTIVILTVATIAAILFIGTESAFSKKTKKKKEESIKSSKIILYPKTGKAKLDSLLACIPAKGEPQDTNFVKLLDNLSFAYHNVDQTKGIDFAQRALKLAEKLNFRGAIPSIYMAWGSNLNMSNKIPEAIDKYNQALKIYEEVNNQGGISAIYGNLGIAYSRINDSTKALEYWNKSLEVSEKINNKEKIADVYLRIGRMYQDYGKNKLAIEYFNKSLTFSVVNDLKVYIAKASESIGWTYKTLSDFPKAMEFAEKAQKAYNEIGRKEDEARIISNIGGDFANLGQYVKSIDYYKQSLKIHEELNLTSGIAYDLGSIGSSYFLLNDFPKMLEYINKAIDINISINNLSNLARNYSVLGYYFSSINEIDSAEYYSNRTLEIYTELKDAQGTMSSLSGLARLYGTRNNYAKAIDYCFKTLKLAEQFGNLQCQGTCYQLLGAVHMNLDEYEISVKYSSKALDIFKKIKDLPNQARTLTNIGSIYLLQKNHEEAIECYMKSIEINEKVGNKRDIAVVGVNLAKIFLVKNDYTKALGYYQKAEDVFKELGLKENLSKIYLGKAEVFKFMALDSTTETTVVRDSLLNLSLGLIQTAYTISEKGKEAGAMHSSLEEQYKIYSKLNNWEQALKYYKEATVLKDSIYSGENKKKIAELEAKKDLEVKQKENELLAERTKLQESELGRQKEQLALLSSKQLIQSLELDKKSLEISTKNNELSLLEKDKEINNIALKQKEAEQDKSTKEIQLLNKDKQYQGVVRKSLFGGVALLTGLATILFLFFWRKKKDNKKLEEKNIQITEQKEIIEIEQEKSEHLLLNVLPPVIATRLKAGETTIADHYDEASVVFIDIVDFTKLSSGQIPPYQGRTDSEIPPYQGGIKGGVNSGFTPEQIVALLNQIYTQFDKIAQKHGLEKIKTIGDCYMAAAGVPEIRKDNPEMAAKFALEAMGTIRNYDTGDGTLINFRCGIDCGPVVAGVIGEKKFIYDLWGDTVNTAARMEEYGEPGRIQVTERFKNTIENSPSNKRGSGGVFFEERGEIEIKGKGKMKTYFLENNHKDLL